MSKLFLLVISLVSLSIGQQFEVVSVKYYDHHSDPVGPWGPYTLFDCHLGPGRLQYNCSGPVSRLIAEALDLQNFQFDEKQHGAEYVLTAKLSKPAKRFEIDAMLAEFLKNQMGVRYHFERRSIKGEFLTVVDNELLKNLPESHNAIPVADVNRNGGRDGRWWDFVERDWPTRDDEELKCKNINFHLLAELLQLYYRTPIIDDTGLSKRFDLTIRIHWDRTEPGPPQIAELKKNLAQHGLALQNRMGPIDFLVIDGAAPESKFIN